MKTLLLIGFILSLIIQVIKIFSWLRAVIFITKKREEALSALKDLKINKSAYIFGGIEHLIIFSVLLASLIIIF